MNNTKVFLSGFFSCLVLFLITGFSTYNQGDILCNSLSIVDDKNNKITIDSDFLLNVKEMNYKYESLNELLVKNNSDLNKFKNQIEKQSSFLSSNNVKIKDLENNINDLQIDIDSLFSATSINSEILSHNDLLHPDIVYRYIEREVEPKPYPGMSVSELIEYPELAKSAGLEGKVVVAAFIDKNGKVKNPYVIEGVYNVLDNAALNAISKSKWIPAKNYDKNIGVWVKIPVSFKFR